LKFSGPVCGWELRECERPELWSNCQIHAVHINVWCRQAQWLLAILHTVFLVWLWK